MDCFEGEPVVQQPHTLDVATAILGHVVQPRALHGAPMLVPGENSIVRGRLMR